MGYASGTIISGRSAAFTICIESRKAGASMSIGMVIASLAALIGLPINGAFVRHYRGFSQLSIFSGVICVFGWVQCGWS